MSKEIQISPDLKLALSIDSETSDERYDPEIKFRRIVVYSDPHLLDDNMPEDVLRNIQAHAIVNAIALAAEFSKQEPHELYGELRVGSVMVKPWSGEFKKS